MGQIDLVMKDVLVYSLYIKTMHLMNSNLPDHWPIYMLIRLRCNHEIKYTHHIRLLTTVQILGRHQASLAKVRNSFQNWWSCRPCLNQINLHHTIIPLVGSHLTIVVTCYNSHSLWQCLNIQTCISYDISIDVRKLVWDCWGKFQGIGNRIKWYKGLEGKMGEGGLYSEG